MKNIQYIGPEIEEYFSKNRISWDGFYPSERELIEKIWPKFSPHILDIGSACGGLGLALEERFGEIASYTGVEFNPQAVITANELNPAALFISGDFLEIEGSSLRNAGYDLVFSLSCIDWQLNTRQLLARAWSTVAVGGQLILSLRLSLLESCTNFENSYQFINNQGLQQGEKAPYVVLNVDDVRTLIQDLGADDVVHGSGYWGIPSSTAVTPFEEICFVVIAITKSEEGRSLTWDLHVPTEVLAAFQNGMSE